MVQVLFRVLRYPYMLTKGPTFMLQTQRILSMMRWRKGALLTTTCTLW